MLDLGSVDVDTCPGAAAVENDVVFGGGVVGVEGVEEKEEEEEEEDEDREEEEVFAANRVGELNRFGFGETGSEVVGCGAMFEVVAIGGEILEGGGDSEVVLDAWMFAKDHVCLWDGVGWIWCGYGAVRCMVWFSDMRSGLCCLVVGSVSLKTKVE